MNTITMSDDYQVCIPEEICEKIGLKVGASFEIIPYNNRLELIPITSIKNLKGIFKGIDTNIIRESDRL